MSLPFNWARTSLGEITFPDRPRENPADYPELPFVGMEHVEAHSMKLLGTVPAGTMKSSAVHFQPNDVLYGRLRPYLNKVLRARQEGLCSAEFIVFSDHGHINPSWLAYRVNSSDFVSFAARLNEGDRPRVDYGQISPFPIHLPPKPEQDRIIAEIEKQFTRLDDAVAALKRVQANLKRYRASVLKAAYEGRLVPTEAELARREGRDYEPASELLKRILAKRRANWEADQLQKMLAGGKPPKDDEWKKRYNEPTPPGTSKLPKLPDGWQWASLDQLFRVERGRFSVRPRNDPRYFNGPYPFVQIGNLPREGGQIISYEQTLNEDGLLVSKLFSKGTVLIAIVGATIANTGILEFDSCCPDSLVGLQGEDGTLLELAEAYLRSKKLVLRQASYSSGGQPNINLAMLLPYPMPLPPEAEQARIIQELQRPLSAIEASENTLQRQIRHASALRRAVLKDAFSGKLVPQDPNDEPASVLLERIRAERARAQEQEQRTPKATNGASSVNGQRRKPGPRRAPVLRAMGWGGASRS